MLTKLVWDTGLQIVGASLIVAKHIVAVKAGKISIIAEGQAVPGPLHRTYLVANLELVDVVKKQESKRVE